MRLIEELKNLSKKIREYSGQDLSEADTETFCFEPFIKLLGFEPNPADMQKQYPADISGGNRTADYAIKKDGVPIMIVECKRLEDNLDDDFEQLKGYFSAVSGARFGVLTNGRLYRFYTDLDESNLMDSDPFLEIDLFDIKPVLVAELERFTKSRFDVDKALAAAHNLKYSKAVRQFLMELLESPTADFITYVASEVNITINTSDRRQQITEIVQQVLKEFKEEVTDPLLPPLLPGPVPPIGPDTGESWTGKEIRGAFTFEGETYQAKDWKDFYVKFFEILSEDNTLQFRDVLELKPSFFSENPDNFPPSAQPVDVKKIGETDIYVFAGISNAEKQRIIGDIVEHFGRTMPVPHTD